MLTMLSLSMVLVALGVYTATRAENISVSGYGSGVIVSRISPIVGELQVLLKAGLSLI